MREIKFEIYSKKQKRMLSSVETSWLDIRCDGEKFSVREHDHVIFDYEDSILRQYTGLKDKNGKDIYEGDIVKIDWRDPRYHPLVKKVEWNEKQAAFGFGAGLASEVPWSHEVIGNIYESPELLKINPT